MSEISCSSTFHAVAVVNCPEYDSTDLIKINRKHKSSKVSRVVYDELLKPGILKWTNKKIYKTYICSCCIVFLKTEIGEIKNSSTSSDSETAKKSAENVMDHEDAVSEAVSLIINSLKNLSTPYKSRLATALGQSVHKDLKNQIGKDQANSTFDNRIGLMKTGRDEDVWQRTNPVLRCFLEAVINTRSSSLEEKHRQVGLLNTATNALYFAIAPRYISPLCQAQSLVLYNLSGSKTACKFFGRILPAGSYGSLLSLRKHLGAVPPAFPTGDVIITYDNNQVVGKQYGVRLHGTIPLSTVTGITVFKDSFQCDLQRNLEFPNFLITPALHLLYKYKAFYKECTVITRQFRTVFIESSLEAVHQSCRIENGEIMDPISADNIQEYTQTMDTINYSHVDADNSHCETFDQQCLSINPNSEKTVKETLDHIIQQLNKSDGTRKWCVVTQDGLPYTIALGIIKETKICNECHLETRTMESHMNEAHGTRDSNNKSTFKYSKIVLRPGNGHYEINLVRAIFNTFFDIYIMDVAKILGFKTPLSLQYCRSACDHHKSWQILEILFISFTEEIMFQYLHNCMTNATEPSVHELFMWVETKSISNKNLQLAFNFVFRVLHPLFLFRAGIRQCNDKVALAAREKVSAIFYGFNHPKYRVINAHDVLYLLTIPEAAKMVVGRQSLRRKGGKVGEGADFLQEGRNKAQNVVIPWRGVPTVEQWRQASCSLSHLEEIIQSSKERLNFSKEEDQGQRNFTKEIFETRKMIRRWGGLREDSKEFCGFGGRLVSPKFVFFLDLCEENRLKYYSAFLEDKKTQLYPVFPFPQGNNAFFLNPSDFKKALSRKIQVLSEPLLSHYKGALKNAATEQEYLDLDAVIEEEFIEIAANLERENTFSLPLIEM